MTPNDLDAYLQVLERHSVGAVVLKLADGVEVHVTFVPVFPDKPGKEPEAGGWKTQAGLDNPSALMGDGDYKGTLP